jgi:hypothetical protein
MAAGLGMAVAVGMGMLHTLYEPAGGRRFSSLGVNWPGASRLRVVRSI